MAVPDDAELAALAGAVAGHLTGSGRTFVAAESCTGGWIAKACTDLPGSSRWFLGSAVAYANEAKTRLLGVPAALLLEHGAVSEPVARAMATGALESLGGDLAVAVTGIAGPDGGTPAKPVGTVWLAWAVRAAGSTCEVSTRRVALDGDRDAVRRRTVKLALQGLLER
ncbi:MAG TPA: CinA family protein [Steroidobacteraceae bacterium]|nr:CinA family protein [Steroidobacteraceae bacterium]